MRCANHDRNMFVRSMIETTSLGSFNHDQMKHVKNGGIFESRIFGRASPRNLTTAAKSAMQNQNLQTILLVPKIAQMLSMLAKRSKAASPPKGLKIDSNPKNK